MTKHSISPIVTLLLSFLITSCDGGNSAYHTIEGFAQGSTYHIIYSNIQGYTPAEIKDISDQILDEINNSISGYNKGSLISRINNGENPPLDSIFIRTFNRSMEIWEESQGAFDPSAAPLFDIWGFGFEDKSKVSESMIDSAILLVGMDNFALRADEDGNTYLEKKVQDSKLNFNAIGQGISCDLVAEELERLGCENYLVEIGREILCKGVSSRGGEWRVGLDKPVDGNMDEGKNLQEIISIGSGGLVTSGNYRKFYMEDGHKYSHTIDPSTGYPVQHSTLSATIIAKDAATADAYATWCMVVGVDSAKKIIPRLDNVEAYIIYGEQDAMLVWHTEGMQIQQ